MKAFVVFITLFVLAACDEGCYNDVYAACNAGSKLEASITHCDAQYGHVSQLQSNIQRFTDQLFYRSFDFLLMSTHYGNYIKNRPGFEKLFRGLSDTLWNDGIDTIKYLTTRGGEMNFKNDDPKTEMQGNWELYEPQAVAKALDIQKELAKHVFEIHQVASTKHSNDPEIAHHFEEKFMEKQRDSIRELAGHSRDLTSFLQNEADVSLALYLFDQYLQK